MDGYFPHGYGMKAKGMGGASVAMANDSSGGANNPASMVWAGDRFDIGVDSVQSEARHLAHRQLGERYRHWTAR